MAALRTAVAVSLLVGLLPLAHAIQVTVVCADLVGAGGVGIRVWPTLKPSPEWRSNSLQFRLLQVNWEAERLLEGDWVGVFNEDPRPPHLRPPPTPLPPTSTRDWRTPQTIFWDTPFATHGTITTNYTQPRIELSVLARGGCVGPYVGFVRNGVCVAAECLASHPTWLYDHRAVLGSRSLRSLVLPGTHNAGSYTLADDNDVVAAWVVCQDEDIMSQLLYGNRYLDLRVGYYPDTHELLWVNHDVVRWRPLQDVLEQVQGFLALSPDPVIIDIHRTPVGFNLPESMELLLSLMNATLGSHFVHSRHGPHVTLDDLWQMGKRVVFTFNDPTVSDYTPWVWPPLPQAWPNAQLLDDLRSYIDSEMNKRFESPRLWAAMAHLTPTFLDVVFRSHVGVRGLTDRVSFSITRWLRQRWGHMANIVASDFFRSNDIINVVIRTNLALSMCRPTDPSRQPYTLRWTTELTLRPGSPSTTIPPFVRRMYSGGALWSTSDVRHIHYPFIPVDANISRVFTDIPARIPSIVPGVTYQNNGDTWREVFHYPTDGSPQPPEAIPPHSAAITSSPATPIFRLTTEYSPAANLETITSEWDTVNSHSLVDEELPDRMDDAELIIITEKPRLSDLLEGPSSDQDSGLPVVEYRGEDTIEAVQGNGTGNLTVPPPFPYDLGDSEHHADKFINISSSSSMKDTPDYDASIDPINEDDRESEYLFFKDNIHQDNDTSLFLNNYNHEEYLMSATITAFLNIPTSPTINATQDLYSLSAMEDITFDNSSALTSTHTNDIYEMPIDDISNTSHSDLVNDPTSTSLVNSSRMVPQDQNEYAITPSETNGTSKGEEIWEPDDTLPSAKSTYANPLGDVFTPSDQEASGHTTEKPQLQKYSTVQTSPATVTLHQVLPRVSVKHVPVTVPALTAQFVVPTHRTTPTVTTEQETTSNVHPVAPTLFAQSVVPTASRHTPVPEVTTRKSSSQVT